MAERNHKGSNATKTAQRTSKSTHSNNMHSKSVSQEVQLSQVQRHSSASSKAVRTQEKDQVRSTCRTSSNNRSTHNNSAVQPAVNSSHNKTELRENVNRKEIRQSKTKGRLTDNR